MNLKQYNKALSKILEDIPQEFHKFLIDTAKEYSLGMGYESTLEELEELTTNFQVALDDFLDQLYKNSVQDEEEAFGYTERLDEEEDN